VDSAVNFLSGLRKSLASDRTDDEEVSRLSGLRAKGAASSSDCIDAAVTFHSELRSSLACDCTEEDVSRL
jgi:hypothetical protein